MSRIGRGLNWGKAVLALPSRGAFGSAVGADAAAGTPLIIAPGELGGPEGRSSAGMAGELTSCAKAGTAPNKTVEYMNQTREDGMAFHSECVAETVRKGRMLRCRR